MTFYNEGEQVTTFGLPKWPKSLIRAAFNTGTTSERHKSLIRRLYSTAINGGIPIDIIEKLQIPVPGRNVTFKRENFASTSLNLRTYSSPINTGEFNLVCKNFQGYIQNSNTNEDYLFSLC